MRRSLEPRVRSQGEILFQTDGRGAGLRATIVNVSAGGVCARGVLPEGEKRGDETTQLGVTLSLEDGAPPVAARAKVAWVAPPQRPGDRDEARTFGLSFVDLSGDARERLGAVVGAEESANAQAAARAIRLRLDGGPALRAEAEAVDERGAILGAELPWLRLGGGASTEIDGRELSGRIDWVGMDVSPTGAARLRIRIAFSPEPRERRDSTLPYFSTDPQRERAAPIAAAIAIANPVEARPRNVTDRVSSLVRLGEKRRVRMGLLRVAIGLLAVSALLLFVRTLRDPQPAVPVVEAPVGAIEPANAAMHESTTVPDLILAIEVAPLEESGTTPPPKAKPKPRRGRGLSRAGARP